MKRSFRWSASPIAAVIVAAGFLATACSAGQGVASATGPQARQSSASRTPSRRRQGTWIATFADPDGNYFQLQSAYRAQGIDDANASWERV